MCLFVLSGLLGGFWTVLGKNGVWLNASLSCAGIGCLLYASIELIRESIMSLEVIKVHFGPLMDLDDTKTNEH